MTISSLLQLHILLDDQKFLADVMCGKTTNWRGRPIGGCSSNEVCHYFKTNCEYKCKYVHGKDSNDDDYINDSTNYNFDINEFD